MGPKASPGLPDLQYLVADSRSVLFELDLSPSCIITSPPYFNVRKYPAKSQLGFGQTFEGFEQDIGIVFGALFMRAKQGATLWVIVDSIRQNGRLLHLPGVFVEIAKRVGWSLQSTLVWLKDRSYPWIEKGRLRKLHELIFLFTKGDSTRLNVDRIREVDDVSEWWLRYPERYNPLGRAPGDVWLYPIPVQGSWGRGFLRHECPFPPRLVERVIDLSTEPGDVVLDPFAGTGVVAAVASQMGRVGWAIDVSATYRQHFESDVKPAVQAWWSRRKVERAEQDQRRETFFRSNIGLRVVKIGKVLAERLLAQGEAVAGCWLSVGRLRRKMPWAPVTLTLLLQKGDVDNVKRRARQILDIPPLSKFGLDVAIKVVRASHFRDGGTAFLYNGLQVSNYSVSSAEFRLLCRDAKHPVVASSLAVRSEDLRSVSTRYWRGRTPPAYLREDPLEYMPILGQMALLKDV